jgi:hypothetical protein
LCLESDLGKERAFWLAIGINFLLTSRARFRLLGLARGRVQDGGDIENLESIISSSAGTEPSICSRRRSIRAPSMAEWRAAPPGVSEGGNDEARPRSKYGRVTIGWFPVSFQFWKRALETRKALEAPGPPGSRPTRKPSI